MRIRHIAFVAIAALLTAAGPSWGQDNSIVVASSTSLQDSGLFGHILPMFEAKTGIEVKVIAEGCEMALDAGRRGDADVVFVHAKGQEDQFVAEGFGVKRFDVMYNDFVLIGPKADPAGIKGGKDVLVALKMIDATGSQFVSRGNRRRGTHSTELALWRAAGLDPAKPKPVWFHEIDEGMGATLKTASAMGAYVLSDRSTWIFFTTKAELEIVVEGDWRLFNQYVIILVKSDKHPSVKEKLGQTFIDWVLSMEGQSTIRAYRIEGQQLFFPNALRWRQWR
jgi:tungstate transport system substrate-binding protein